MHCSFLRIFLITIFLLSHFSYAHSKEQKSDQILLRFSHVAAPQSHKNKGALKFKELAEKYTKGRVRVEIYPNSQLYKDKEELEALQLGAVEMLAPSLSKFAPLGIKSFEIFDLPFLFKDLKDISKITEGPIGQELLQQLQEKDIVGLTYWNNGFKILSANKPLIKPDDILGLKMRIQSSRVIEEQILELGAIPQVMAFSEAYQALSSGVVDGTENTLSNMQNQKMYEVQRFATLTFHGFLGYAVIINKRFWVSLPDEIRENLQTALKEATRVANEAAVQENMEALLIMQKKGPTQFHTPTIDEKKAWEDALKNVKEKVSYRINATLMERIENTLKNHSP
ncbi:MAG: DctP family TRAP transporter solute-binding subunit [Hyphomicrobium sp.]